MSIRGLSLRNSATVVLFSFCLLTPAARSAAAPPDGGASDPYTAILAEQAIAPDLPAIVKYLGSLPPSDDNRRHIAQLVAQLGHDDFGRRELATRQLVALPVVPVELLRAAADNVDEPTELRLRARSVIAQRAAGNASSTVAVACFRTIARRKLTGATAPILDVVPLYGQEFVLAAARDALKATSRTQDIPLLRRAVLAEGPTDVRVAAAVALAAVAGDAARADLLALAADDWDARVRLTAARALADRGDRACLPPLVDLLWADEVRVRGGAIATLRALTGRPSDYAAWLDPAGQSAAVHAWESWLATDNARTAPLKYPLRPGEDELGRTLMCLYAQNQVVELDATGRQVFAVTVPNGCPWACQGLPNGGRLVALYSANTLVEYRADGKERTRIPVAGGPMSVQRLDNGNTLVAANNAQKVVEIDGTGNVVWEITLDGGPCDAVRLDNGRTLVTLQNANAVVEIDSAGKEVWKVDGLHTPRTATRLDNGNTLICDLGSGKVIEVDAAGAQTWSQSGFNSPFSAQRLSTGSTLISDTTGVKEIDREGRVLNETKRTSLGRVWRY